METPSGQEYLPLDFEILRLMVQAGFIIRRDKPFKLKSGILSNVYVFGREDITDNTELEWVIGLKIAMLVMENSLPDDKQHCLIGIPTAGTALAQAGAMVSYGDRIYASGNFICHRVMREALKKDYGVHPEWVNGNPRPKIHTYWSVDNVVTDGSSKFEANERLKESGYPVESMPSLVFVDRQQGGIRKMEEKGFKRIVVAYKLLDMTFAFGELNLWPKSAVKEVEEEIKAHQFL